ncbi:hypothetical protein OSTOST_18051 [Ostertagia ostertagi]
MVRDAARHLDADSIHKASMCAMAKLHVTENCSEVVNQALQMFRWIRLSEGLPYTTVHHILEGSNEIMRLIVGRDLLNNQTYGPM